MPTSRRSSKRSRRSPHRGLASFCDVYCDDGYFTLAESRRILEAGLAHGLRPKLHLDAYSHTGAALLAAELGAITVDHLNHTSAPELEALAAAGVVGVVMPLLDFAAQNPTATHARTLLDAGVRIALATDICPGCYTREHAGGDPARVSHGRALGRPGDPGRDHRCRRPRSGAARRSVRWNPESRPTS